MNDKDLLQHTINYFRSELEVVRRRLTEIEQTKSFDQVEILSLAMQQEVLADILIGLLKDYVKDDLQQMEMIDQRTFERELQNMLNANCITRPMTKG